MVNHILYQRVGKVEAHKTTVYGIEIKLTNGFAHLTVL